MLVTHKLTNSNYYSAKRCLLIWNIDTNPMTIFHRLYRCYSNQTDFKLTNGFDNETVDNITDKVVYNSVVKKGKDYITKLHFVKKEKEANKKMNAKINNTQIVPIALRQMLDSETLKKLGLQLDETEERDSVRVNLPYAVQDRKPTYIVDTDDNNVESTSHQNNAPSSNAVQDLVIDRPAVGGKKWMCDYECFNDAELEDGVEEWQVNYGTHDASVPVSKTPCGGCGAILHCQNPSIPGYLPSELFKNCCDEATLRSVTCQRCHFLRHYNMALSVSVEPDYYPRLLSKIRNEKALVILLVDLTDFPCSIWPDLLDIIGKNRPIFLVGNKVDVLWGDSAQWLENAKESLRAALPHSANILHTALISAKTGFGVEELITTLQNVWQYRGDVYLIGCTNVGKSTLFNAMLQSDYCKVKAVDLVQRATTAPWPGTTLNLLKFPILRPDGWRLFLRTKRFAEGKHSYNSEGRLFKEQYMLKDKHEAAKPHLMGHIGRTFYQKRQKREMEEFAMNVGQPKNINEALRRTPGSGLDPNDKDLALSRWLYDTPGVIQPDQFINLLTHEELMLTLPRDLLRPRTFSIRPGQTLMIAGLSRIDYMEGEQAVRMTVFSPNCLPITVCEQINADTVYREWLGTKNMAVPTGESSRLAQWPGLSQGEPFTLMGRSEDQSCADVVLSNSGWVAVTPAAKVMCRLSGWTPGARGIHVRVPPLLPFAVNLRGNMIRRTSAYGLSRPYLT